MRGNLHSVRPIISHTGFYAVLLVIASLVFNSCKEEPQFWKVDSVKQVIGDYVANNPDQFSEFDM